MTEGTDAIERASEGGAMRAERFAAKVRLGKLIERLECLVIDAAACRTKASQLAEEMNGLRQKAADLAADLLRERDGPA